MKGMVLAGFRQSQPLEGILRLATSSISGIPARLSIVPSGVPGCVARMVGTPAATFCARSGKLPKGFHSRIWREVDGLVEGWPP